MNKENNKKIDEDEDVPRITTSIDLSSTKGEKALEVFLFILIITLSIVSFIAHLICKGL